ncbi:hypothetical protein BDV38DRAFT_258303, partial [Aspergillus pseudotamarii]
MTRSTSPRIRLGSSNFGGSSYQESLCRKHPRKILSSPKIKINKNQVRAAKKTHQA